MNARRAVPWTRVCGLMLWGVVTSVCAASADSARPNIVVILADDFGYGSAGCYGANPALVPTPGLDRLAKEGRCFLDANTTSSVCAPTRYSVLTGRYCWRTSLTHEVLGVFAPLHIETNRLTMASLLKKHGYATAAVGKWHLGYGASDGSPQWRTDYTAELSPGPLDIGFDYHFGVPSNHGDITGVFVENRFVYGLRSGNIPPGVKIAGPAPNDDRYQKTYGPEDMENARSGVNVLDLDAPRRKNEYVMATLTDKAVAWLEQQPGDQPFFLYFTPVAVHNPITPGRDIAGRSAAGPYGDWIHELDRGVARILETLDRIGAAQNTLVLFTSDNGGVFKPERPDMPQMRAAQAGLRINGDERGGKHDVWNGGFKVPFIVRWPGKALAGSRCAELISLVDILATTAAIVGEPLPGADAAAEDSRSFLSAILGTSKNPVREDVILHSTDGVFAVRRGPWKWIEGLPADGVKPAALKVRADQHRAQLFDLRTDPAETTDVSVAHPEVVRELSDLLRRYRDGGYSRELPPPGVAKKTPVAVLPPVTGPRILDEALARMPAAPWVVARGKWGARNEGVWGAQDDKDTQGATLRVPVEMIDGVVEYEIRFDGAGRHSLRVEWGRREGSFRFEISRTMAGIAKNPSVGEDARAVQPLAQKTLKLEPQQWYPVRIAFSREQATLQVNETVVTASHAVIGKPKSVLNFLVFGRDVGFRNVRAAR